MQFNFIRHSVHGVVTNLQQELAAVYVADVHGVGIGLTRHRIGNRTGISQRSRTGRVIQDSSRNVLVVAGGYGQGLSGKAHRNVIQLRCRIIHSSGGLQVRTFAQGVPVHRTVIGHVVLRGQRQGNLNAFAFSHTRGRPVDIQRITSAHPHAIIVIEIGSGNSAGECLSQNLIGGQVGHSKARRANVTDSSKGSLGNFVASLAVDGVPLGHVNFIGNQGVAAKVVSGIRVIAVDDRIGVGFHVAQIRRAGLFASGIFLIGAHVKHGSIGPVAVERQNRDGVAGAFHALGISQGIDEDIAFHICTAGVVGVQVSLLFISKLHGHGDLDRIAGRHGNGIFTQLVQEEVGVIGIYITIAVDIGIGGSINGGRLAADIVQQRLSIILIHLAIVVEIAVGHFTGGIHQLAVSSPGNVSSQSSGQGVHVISQFILRHIGVGIVHKRILGKQIRRQLVHPGFVIHIVDVEAKGVDTAPLRIVAQLSFHLAVGLAVHHDVGIGAGCRSSVCQAGALLDNRIIGIRIHLQGNCSGHHQALGQRAVSDAVLGQAILLYVLLHQSRNTGDLGSRHGSTAHQLVLIVGSGGAQQRINAAARGSDLRLQAQVSGNTPGAELTHGQVFGLVVGNAQLPGDGQRAGVICTAGRVSGSSGVFPNELTGLLRNGNAGSSIFIVGQVQVDDARFVVINHSSGSSGGSSGIALLKEGGFTTGAEHNLTGYINVRKVLGSAEAVNEDILILRTCPLCGGVQGSHRLVAVVGLGINEGLTGYAERITYAAIIIHRGYGQGIGEGARGTASMVVHTVQEQIAKGRCILRPVAIVTSRHDRHGVGAGQRVHNRLIIIASGEASVAGTQRQVHRIAAQNDGVFNGSHVVGVISAAGSAKDLHHDDLGIRSIANHADVVHGGDEILALLDITVSRCNTSNVRAVVGLAIIHMRDVQAPVNVVVAKGNLQIDVEILGCNAGRTLINIEQR